MSRCVVATCRSNADCGAGRCVILSTDLAADLPRSIKLHCVAAGDPCELASWPQGQASCPPSPEGGGQICIFQSGTATCAPAPLPPP